MYLNKQTRELVGGIFRKILSTSMSLNMPPEFESLVNPLRIQRHGNRVLSSMKKCEMFETLLI